MFTCLAISVLFICSLLSQETSANVVYATGNTHYSSARAAQFRVIPFL